MSSGSRNSSSDPGPVPGGSSAGRRFRPGRFLGAAAALGLILYVVGYQIIWMWTICRVEVPPGESLMLRYKGPFPPFMRSNVPVATDELVERDERGRPKAIGILAEMLGPGRHFVNPLEYETKAVPDTIVNPGEIGVVTSKVGKPLPPNRILADEEGYKGIRRRVLTPGRYRLNTAYAFDVRIANLGEAANVKVPEGASLIPAGYVGVVTNKAPREGETQGIQDDVLQPGIYFLNPYEKHVDVVGIGYAETSMINVVKEPALPPDPDVVDPVTKAPLSRRPDPVFEEGTGIAFPSSNAFPIHLDFTVIWGVMPEQAPSLVRQFGTWDDVERKVIVPQVGSICRLNGSKRGALDLLVGNTREAFQTDVSEELERVMESKNLTLLFGLTRHIYVPYVVREAIQKAKIADEYRETFGQQQETAKMKADLEEAIAKIDLEKGRTEAETRRKVAELEADGEKQAREIEATTEKMQAAIQVEASLVQAEITRVLGEADARKDELANRARAERFQMAVEALGGPESYNRHQFAENLPDAINLGVFYAGPGTFWTDLKGMEQVLLGKTVSDSENPPPARGASAGPSSPVSSPVSASGVFGGGSGSTSTSSGPATTARKP